MMKYLTAALCALLAGLSAPPASAGPAAAAAEAADPLESARSAEIRASVEQCRSDRLEALLDAGADPNVFMENGDTAFTYAMRTDCVRCADLLMKAKSFRVNAANRFGETPLMLAVFKGNEEIFEALLRAGADPKAQPKSWTALHYAATEGREDFVKRLLELGVSPNVQTSAGVTPLHMAARRPSRAVVVTLLRAGAYRDYCTDRGLSPADFARKAGDDKLADYLAVEVCAVKGVQRPSLMR